MRITKVYTRTGDKGLTRLVGGQQVAKNHIRICSYGTVDELNAAVGLIRTHNTHSNAASEAVERLDKMLRVVQNDLFNVGSDLATPPDSRWESMYRVGDTDVSRLEGWIDDLNSDLEPLREFILPGGGMVGAHFHLARTICRRAEREVLTLIQEEPEVGEGVMRYLNRLSDYLFVAGRWAARALGEEEYMWDRPGSS